MSTALSVVAVVAAMVYGFGVVIRVGAGLLTLDRARLYTELTYTYKASDVAKEAAQGRRHIRRALLWPADALAWLHVSWWEVGR